MLPFQYRMCGIELEGIMRANLDVFSFLRVSTLGACPYCMRKSLQAFILSACVTLALYYASGTGPVLYTSISASVLLMLLWLSHIAAFSLRNASSEQTGVNASRRASLGRFAKIAAATAAGTAFGFSHAWAKSCRITCSGGSIDSTCRDNETCNCECRSSGLPGCSCHPG